MTEIKSYRDLEVWKQSRDLVEHVYQLTRDFPPDERYGLTSQIRRAAVSIPSNIAEGAARSGTAEFLQFLGIASGSLAELETQLLLASRLRFAEKSKTDALLKEATAISLMLRGLKRSLRSTRK